MAYAADDPVPVTEDGLFGAPEEALFGASEDDLFSFDEDSLFGGDLLIEVDDPGGQALEEVFLVRDRIDAGGTYRAALAWSRMTGEDGQELWSGLSLTAGGSLYVDARPRRDFRAFAKLKGSGAWREGAGDADVTAALHELFVDVDHKDRAFFRIGKQTVTWGVGYFFSPADVINVGRINPEDPEAEREGPVAVRLHVPDGRTNWYGFLLVDGGSGDGYRVALAPKAEFVLGRSEVGVGLYYREDRAPRAMATLSTSVGPVALFGELVVSKGSDKRLVRETVPSPLNPWGVETYVDRETLFTHVTAGARYTYSDPDGRFRTTGAAQLYYNGEGYDGPFLEKHGLKLPVLAALGRLRAGDLENRGRLYGALLLTGSHQRLKDVGASVLWLGNLSDGSGVVTFSVDYSGWKYLKPSVSYGLLYGDPGSEWAPPGRASQWLLSVGVSGSF